jgi:hypothetical protein
MPAGKRPTILQQYEEDATPMIEIVTELLPVWADTVMVQVQDPHNPQVCFWPVRIFPRHPEDKNPRPS